MHRATALAQDFLLSVGPQLQEKLLERDASEPLSWLATWWNDHAYMLYRESVVINVSFAMPFLMPHDVPRMEQALRGATLVSACLHFCRRVRNGLLPREKGRVDQRWYPMMFSLCRVPQMSGCDSLTSSPGKSHIVVACRENFYVVDCARTTVASLRATFQHILDDRDAAEPAVGILTSVSYTHLTLPTTPYV